MKITLAIFLLLVTYSLQSQVSESWNLDIDEYTHNSSNYFTKSPPIEIAKFSNNEKAILTQKGTLIKITSSGKVIWKKEIKACSQQRIVIDTYDNIILSCGSTISKLNTNGEVIWKKEYDTIFKKKYLTFDAITVQGNKTYITGHFFHSRHICQITIDIDGNVVWKSKFKQGIEYEHEFLPPKQIVVLKNQIYILAHHYVNSKSFLYTSNLKGKKRKEKQIDYKIKKLKVHNDSLFALGHLNNRKNDALIFTLLDTNLEIKKEYNYKLPRNLYVTFLRGLSGNQPTKEELERDYITGYDVNDFEFLNSENILVIGHSKGDNWITHANLNNGIAWSWDPSDNRYFNFNNEMTTYHYSSLFSVHQENNDTFLLGGISTEEDNHEEGFKKFIHTFIREIKIKNKFQKISK